MLRNISKFRVFFVLVCLASILLISGGKLLSGLSAEAGTKNDTVHALKLFDDADKIGKAGRPDSALKLLSEAREIYRKKNLGGMQARCLNKMAEQYINAGAFAQAAPIVSEALQLSQKAGDQQETGGAYNNLGTILANTGKADSAMICFDKAISTWISDKGENQTCVGEGYINMAVILWMKQQTDRAQYYALRSIAIIKATSGPDADNLSYAYSIAGTIAHAKGDYPTSIKYNRNAVDIWFPKYGDGHPLMGGLYNNLGEAYNEIGNFTDGLIYLKKARIIMELHGKNNPLLLSVIHNIGNALIRVRRYDDALAAFREVLYLASVSGTSMHDISLTYNDIGMIFFTWQKYDSAAYYYLKGLEIANSAGRLRSQAFLNANLGVMYTNTGNYDEATKIIGEAINTIVAKKVKKHPQLARSYYQMGNVYFDLKDYSTALKYLQQSIICNVIDFEDNSVSGNPTLRNILDKGILLYSLDSKAATFASYYYRHPDSLGAMKLAFECASLAVSLTDSIRAEKTLEDSQWIIDRQTNPFPMAIQCAYILYHRTGDPSYLDKAFVISEKSRYSALYKSIKELEARNIGRIPDSLQDLERSLRVQVAYHKKQISDERLKEKPDEKKIKAIEQVQFALNTATDSLKKAFEKQYPEYYQLKYKTTITTVKDVQQKLKADEALVEYALTDQRLITFIITRTNATMIGTMDDRGMDQKIDRFRQLIHKKEVSEQSLAEYNTVAGELYDLLLSRAEPLIKGKKLIIVPDGKLGTIPFEALVNRKEMTGQPRFNTLHYVLKDHSIGYGYSATIFLNSLEVTRHSAAGRILAFAPSFNSSNKSLLAELNERGTEFADLAGAREEVKTLGTDFGGRVYLDSAATKQNFLQHSPDYEILHISTHGIINDAKPLESKLVFFQKNDTADANLYVYELFNMKLNAKLVTLSACNTGYGKLADGEGIMSLSSAFMYSGVPAILSTLWGVNDKSSAAIMKDYYQYLDKKEEKPEALRNAQLGFLARADNITAHPYYWAGFIQIGNNQPVLGSNWLSILFAAIAFLLLLSTGYLANGRKERNTRL